MTTLLNDAKGKLRTELTPPTFPYVVTQDLLYADDTLIIDTDCGRAQRYMHIIAEIGAT